MEGGGVGGGSPLGKHGTGRDRQTGASAQSISYTSLSNCLIRCTRLVDSGCRFICPQQTWERNYAYNLEMFYCYGAKVMLSAWTDKLFGSENGNL